MPTNRTQSKPLERVLTRSACESERVKEWSNGKVTFPSVRLNSSTLIDFFVPDSREPTTINQDHLCLEIKSIDLVQLKTRCMKLGIGIHDGPGARWGARGDGAYLYIYDPDKNVVELKFY